MHNAISEDSYKLWIQEVEQHIDAEMRAYWRLIEINGSFIARHARLNKADRYVRELEKYRQRLYNAQASQGLA
jgi:hypothetical protein